eukprot:10588472-Lingulodinium_polyedra.AAC.1
MGRRPSWPRPPRLRRRRLNGAVFYTERARRANLTPGGAASSRAYPLKGVLRATARSGARSDRLHRG